MSWDIGLKEKKWDEDQNKFVVEKNYIGNYTYNISPMYLEAMGKTPSDFHNYKARNLLPILEKGINDMQNNPDKYNKLNPVNGWGNSKGAMNFLVNIKNMCKAYPNSRLEVY